MNLSFAQWVRALLLAAPLLAAEQPTTAKTDSEICDFKPKLTTTFLITASYGRNSSRKRA
ncbi:MAG: hypothetical protein WBS22_06415 [Methylocystis sp.]